MKLLKAATAALALAATPALANEQVVVGATVQGPEGNAVGTIEAIADGVVTLNTGKHKAPLPANAFGQGETGPTITVTKAQLNAMLDEQIAAAAAKRDAALLVAAAVITADQQPLGTIESIEGDDVVVLREAGPVAFKRDHFAVDANGQLMALFTLQQIDQAAAAAVAADDSAATEATS